MSHHPNYNFASLQRPPPNLLPPLQPPYGGGTQVISYEDLMNEESYRWCQQNFVTNVLQLLSDEKDYISLHQDSSGTLMSRIQEYDAQWRVVCPDWWSDANAVNADKEVNLYPTPLSKILGLDNYMFTLKDSAKLAHNIFKHYNHWVVYLWRNHRLVYPIADWKNGIGRIEEDH